MAANRANMKALLGIAERRMSQKIQQERRKVQEEANKRDEQFRSVCTMANNRISEALKADVEKIRAKAEKLVADEVANNPNLARHMIVASVHADLSVRSGPLDSHTALTAFESKLHSAYWELELTLALADSPASLKAEFDKFLAKLV